MSGRRLDPARGCVTVITITLILWAAAYLLAHVAGQGWAP